jgi:hypothetical protein
MVAKSYTWCNLINNVIPLKFFFFLYWMYILTNPWIDYIFSLYSLYTCNISKYHRSIIISSITFLNFNLFIFCTLKLYTKHEFMY